MKSLLHAQFSKLKCNVSKRERWANPELEEKEQEIKRALTRLLIFRRTGQVREKPRLNYQVIVEAIRL